MDRAEHVQYPEVDLIGVASGTTNPRQPNYTTLLFRTEGFGG